MIEIPSRYEGAPPVYRSESAETLKDALEEAVAKGLRLDNARLVNARLDNARLDNARLDNARLDNARLDNAWLNWQSHDLLAEIMRRAAGDNIGKRKVAGLISVSRDWCWRKFLSTKSRYRSWALRTLAAHVRDGDNAPECLRRLAAKLSPASAPSQAGAPESTASSPSTEESP